MHGHGHRRWSGAGIVAFIVMIAFAACGGSEQAPRPAAPPAVVVTPAVEQTIPVYSDHVGQTEAVETVEIRARVEGFLQERKFTEGALVAEGQVLFVIDPRPLEEMLRQAEGQLAQDQAALARAREDVQTERAQAALAQAEAALLKAQHSQELQQAEAQLASHEATLVRAQRDAARFRQLFAQQLVAAVELDAAVAAEKQAQGAADASRATLAQARVNQRQAIADATAAVHTARAAITQARVTQRTAIDQAMAAVASDHAAIAQAKLNLDYTTIRSPLAGLIGRASVDVGSFVGRGEPTLLATVSTIDPIHVAFTTTERAYLEATKQLSAGTPQLSGRTPQIAVTLLLADDSRYPHPGVVTFVDRAVNPETNTLAVRARFPNPGGLLRPGGRVRVRVRLTERADAVLVPQPSVHQGQDGTSVFVVGTDGIVEQRRVEMGSRHGSLWLVERGLEAGEFVVVEGVQKIRPGIKVAPTMATGVTTGS